MSHLIGTQTGGVITAHFIYTRSERGTTVVLTDDDVWVGREPALEIWSYRGDKDEEEVLRCWMHTYLSTRSDEQRTHIECGATLVWRYEALVEADHFLHHLLETLDGQLGHEYAVACALQTFSILVHTEHAHFAIRATIRLQALESLLSVVETCGSHVKRYGLFRTHFDFSPSAVTVVATHVVVGLVVSKT